MLENINISSLKNIIFDLGGVIINIDWILSVEAFAHFNPHLKAKISSETYKSDTFIQYEKGLISDKEFRKQVQESFGFQAKDMEFDNAWNGLLLDIPIKRIELIKSLRSRFNVYLLSNTNAIHIRGVEKILQKDTGEVTLQNLFDKVYYSYEMHKRKPDAEIYQQILDEQGIIPQETLFLDDSLQNLEGAKRLGIQTLHISPNSDTILSLENIWKKERN